MRFLAATAPDDCATWTAARVLQTEASGYSNLTVTPDGVIFCVYEVYENGVVKHMTDRRLITAARFDPA